MSGGARRTDGGNGAEAVARTDGPDLVVLAAGLARRYRRLKQVDPLGPGGAAMMDYNLYDAARAGFARAVLVVRSEIEAEVRAHVSPLVGEAFPIAYAHQSLDDLPGGFRTPPDRRKPWGTAHAILCAARHVDGPFAVCNADDLYGADAFRKLHAHLTSPRAESGAALVGYALAETVSGSGGVSRGVCVLGRDRLLERVTEVWDVRRVDGWIAGEDADGEVVELSGREIASMNLWALSPAVVERLRRQFGRFLARWGANVEAEFLLSTAINDQIQGGQTRVEVLHAHGEWLGVTHPSDRDEARRHLRERVEAGRYPSELGRAFATLGAAPG